MTEKKSLSFGDKNKLAYAAIRIVKENIVEARVPLYNPITLVGLDKGLRYRIFWAIFNKEFNRDYKNTYRYIHLEKMDLNDVQNERLVIIENIESLSGDEALQSKTNQLLMKCFEQKIQVILCSDVTIEKLEIDEVLKSRMLSGLILYLNR